MGVCVPWRDAHVRTGQRNRQPWEDHLSYLQHLAPLLRSNHSLPTVVLGDFNQRIPRTHQPTHVAAALKAALSPDFRLATAGAIPSAPSLSIDHLAVNGSLTAQQVNYLSQLDEKGRKMSDHFGLRIIVA